MLCHHRPRCTPLGVVATAVVAIALASACRAVPEPVPAWRSQVEAWAWPQPLPAFELVDQRGATFRLDRHRDDWVLMSFVFTRCHVAAACPLTMGKLVAAQEAWREVEASGRTGDRRLAILALTLDPAWDTPERLAAFGARHGIDPARFTLATGPEPLLADALPSMLSVLALPDAHEGIRHSVKVVLLRPGLVFDAEWKDEDFEPGAAIARVLSEDGPAKGRGD